jgi:hypothetical protein
VPGGESQTVRLRLRTAPTDDGFSGFEEIFESRVAEVDEFYQRIAPKALSEDESRVHRQTLAGMLWSKQYYYLELQYSFQSTNKGASEQGNEP